MRSPLSSPLSPPRRATSGSLESARQQRLARCPVTKRRRARCAQGPFGHVFSKPEVGAGSRSAKAAAPDAEGAQVPAPAGLQPAVESCGEELSRAPWEAVQEWSAPVENCGATGEEIGGRVWVRRGLSRSLVPPRRAPVDGRGQAFSSPPTPHRRARTLHIPHHRVNPAPEIACVVDRRALNDRQGPLLRRRYQYRREVWKTYPPLLCSALLERFASPARPPLDGIGRTVQ